jgi:hypothetical protein
MKKSEAGVSWRMSLPEGALAWDQVLEYPYRFVPWPYTPEEFAAIVELLPGPSQDTAITTVLWASRLLIRRAKRWVSTPDKPNVRRELKHIQDATLKLRKAIEATSGRTHQHLNEMTMPGIVPEGERPCSLSDLQHTLHRFEIHNRQAFNEPPREAKGGPRTKHHEKDFFNWTKRAFDICNKGAQGYYEFERRCADPLQGPGLLTRLDAKARQKKRKLGAAVTHKKALS